MHRASANEADENDLLHRADRSHELNERFASILTGLPPMDPMSPPRTPPRLSGAYDEIPTAAVVPQSPVVSGYAEHHAVAHHRSPTRMYGTTFIGSTDVRSSSFQSPPRTSRDDELVDGLFQLGLSPGSPATSFGVNLTPTRGSSSTYGSSTFERDDSARSTSASPASPKQQHSLYKTELCRSWEESGACRYGAKCQFAHGRDELRPVLRHPKYKTEVCRTFAAQGCCPYGSRCRFIHYRPGGDDGGLGAVAGLAAASSASSASSAAANRRDAVSALVSTARHSDWTDPFLGTPPPLDPRPTKRRDRISSVAADESSSSPPSARLSAEAEADASDSARRVGESALDDDDDDDDDVLSPPIDTTIAAEPEPEPSDPSEDDVRRLPVFADIASSPSTTAAVDTDDDDDDDDRR